MTKFKDALDEYEGDYLDFYNGPPSEETDATIRLALKIADAVTGEPSEGMINAGFDNIYRLETTLGKESAQYYFRAMIEQMMREIGDER